MRCLKTLKRRFRSRVALISETHRQAHGLRGLFPIHQHRHLEFLPPKGTQRKSSKMGSEEDQNPFRSCFPLCLPCEALLFRIFLICMFMTSSCARFRIDPIIRWHSPPFPATTIRVLLQSSDVEVQIYSNVSFGLNHEHRLHHQCTLDDKFRFADKDNNRDYRMNYTPNRQTQKDTQRDAEAAQIILPIIICDPRHPKEMGSLDIFMGVWDSWATWFLYDEVQMQHAMRPSVFTIVLLFDYYDFAESPHYPNEKGYLDDILINNMNSSSVDCVTYSTESLDAAGRTNDTSVHKVRRASKQPSDEVCEGRLGNERSHLLLDQGYWLYKFHRVVIFAGVHRFKPPDWAIRQIKEKSEKGVRVIDAYDDREVIYANFPHHQYNYFKATSWYVFPMLNLFIIDYFDYVAKIDTDMVFYRPMPENILRSMIDHEKNLLTMYDLYDDRGTGKGEGVVNWLDKYVIEEQGQCNGVHASGVVLRPADGRVDNPLYWRTTDHQWKTIYSNFMIAWLGLYSSPEVTHLAHSYEYQCDKARFEQRWSDQSWWPHPLVLFNRNSSQGVTMFLWEHWGAEKSKLAGGMVMKHKLECLIKAPRGSWYAVNNSYEKNFAMRKANRKRLNCAGHMDSSK